MPSAPITSDPPPPGPERLRAGQHRVVWLDEGVEVRCLRGTLRLRPARAVLDEPAALGERPLRAPSAWRSHRGQWIGLTAIESADYRLEAAPTPTAAPPARAARRPKQSHPEPRGAGWLGGFAAGWLRRAAIRLRRARRAA